MDPVPDEAADDADPGHREFFELLERLNETDRSGHSSLDDTFLGLDLPPLSMDAVHEVIGAEAGDLPTSTSGRSSAANHLLSLGGTQPLSSTQLLSGDEPSHVSLDVEVNEYARSNPSSTSTHPETIAGRLGNVLDEPVVSPLDQFQAMVNEERSATRNSPARGELSQSTTPISQPSLPDPTTRKRSHCPSDVFLGDPHFSQGTEASVFSVQSEPQPLRRRPSQRLQELLQSDISSRVRAQDYLNGSTYQGGENMWSPEPGRKWLRSMNNQSGMRNSLHDPFIPAMSHPSLPCNNNYNHNYSNNYSNNYNSNVLDEIDSQQSFTTHTLSEANQSLCNSYNLPMTSYSLSPTDLPNRIDLSRPAAQVPVIFKRPIPAAARDGMPSHSYWTPEMPVAPHNRLPPCPPNASPFCDCQECYNKIHYPQVQQPYVQPPDCYQMFQGFQQQPTRPGASGQHQKLRRMNGHTASSSPYSHPHSPYPMQQPLQEQPLQPVRHYSPMKACSELVSSADPFYEGFPGSSPAFYDREDDQQVCTTPLELAQRKASVAKWLETVNADFFSSYGRPPTPDFLVGHNLVFKYVCPQCDNLELPCTEPDRKRKVKLEPVEKMGSANAAEMKVAPCAMTTSSTSWVPGSGAAGVARSTAASGCLSGTGVVSNFGRHNIPIQSAPSVEDPASQQRANASQNLTGDREGYSRPRPFDLELLEIGNFRIDNQNMEQKRYITKVKVVPAKKRIIYEFPITVSANLPSQVLESQQQQARSFALMVPFYTITGFNADNPGKNVFLTINQSPLLFSSDGTSKNAISFDKTSSVDPSGGEIYHNRLHRIQLKGSHQVDRFVASVMEFHPSIKNLMHIVLNTKICFHRTAERLPEGDDI